MLKFHRTRKNGNPIWIFVMKPAMQTEIGDPKNKNVCPCFDYSCVTMLPWTHHCLAFEILAIQLKHSPRWTNRQSHLNYPSRWTNPSDHCLRIIIDSIQITTQCQPRVILQTVHITTFDLIGTIWSSRGSLSSKSSILLFPIDSSGKDSKILNWKSQIQYTTPSTART